jgi:hypothetical protein
VCDKFLSWCDLEVCELTRGLLAELKGQVSVQHSHIQYCFSNGTYQLLDDDHALKNQNQHHKAMQKVVAVVAAVAHQTSSSSSKVAGNKEQEQQCTKAKATRTPEVIVLSD